MFTMHKEKMIVLHPLNVTSILRYFWPIPHMVSQQPLAPVGPMICMSDTHAVEKS